MKKLNKIVAIIFILSFTVNGYSQSQKIIVLEDAFIQGGETSGIAFGETVSKNLRIFKSNEDTKYSRITYLKFKLPKKMNEVSSVDLNINLKVFKDNERPNEIFNLQVYAVENDKWNELSITWNDALELGQLVGEMDVPQSLDDKNQKLKIKLNAKEISKLIDGERDREVTLALLNTKFNKISAMATSKEQSEKVASFLIIE